MDAAEVADRLEITDLLTRYTRGVDTHDWDRLDTVFTPDAHIDYTTSGGIAGPYAEVKPWLAEMLPQFFRELMHTLGQVEVTPGEPDADGRDTAKVVAYFHNPMTMDDGQGGEKVVEVGGLYHPELARTDGGWRSRRLYEDVKWKRGL